MRLRDRVESPHSSLQELNWREAIEQLESSTHPESSGGLGTFEPPVMERLREATSSIHDAVESLEFNARLMEGELTPVEYGAWLRALWAIHAPMEEELRARDDDLIEAVWSERRMRAPHLADDLDQLDVPLHGTDDPKGARALEIAEKLVGDWSDLETLDLLGALYVTEGSTLGGMYIAKQLRTHSEVLGEATSFYTAHGRETRELWDQFTEAMNETIRQPDSIARCTRAARVLFLGIGDILKVLS